MANTIAGMFADPNSFRDERINDLMKQRQAIGQMGGSMNQLLGQVAAGGGATGAMMAEGLGGMFGMQTPEEAKAAEIQRAADFLPEGKGLDTAEGATFMAQRLNNLGYTAEAVKMLEHAQAMRDADVTRALQAEKLREAQLGTFKPIPAGKKYNPTTGETETQYLLYNERTEEFRNLDGTPYKGDTPTVADEDPTIKGGSASDYAREKGWTTK